MDNYEFCSWRKLGDLVLASLNCKDLLHKEIRICKLRFMVLAKENLESATRWCGLYLYRLVEVHQSLFVSFLVLF